MLLRSLFSLLILLPSINVAAQKLKKADKLIVTNLQSHIRYLADDKLEGRRAGTAGEKLASEYIGAQFQGIGLEPKGTNKWLQPFEINDGKQVNPTTLFFINGADLRLNTEFFPLAISPNKSTEAAVSMALPERGVPWFLDLKDLMEENKDNPHFDLGEAIKTKANNSAGKGATALIIYNTSTTPDNLVFNGKDRSELATIPILYVTADSKEKIPSAIRRQP